MMSGEASIARAKTFNSCFVVRKVLTRQAPYGIKTFLNDLMYKISYGGVSYHTTRRRLVDNIQVK